mgnify:CR=1 FL=1
MKENIRIAIQKSGRLNEESLKLLNSCGIAIKTSTVLLKKRSRYKSEKTLRQPPRTMPETGGKHRAPDAQQMVSN